MRSGPGKQLRVILGLAWALLLCQVSVAQDPFVVDAVVEGTDNRNNQTYLRVSVRNSGGKPSNYRLTFEQYGGTRIEVDGPTLAPGANTMHHLAIPLFSPYYGNISGNETGFSITRAEERSYLRISEPHDALTREEMAGFTMTFGGSGYGSSYTTATLPEQSNILGNITAELLPSDWKCYLAFKHVLIDANSWRQLSDARRDALESWVMSGGRVTVYDSADDTTKALGRGNISTLKLDPIRAGTNPFTDSRPPFDELMLNRPSPFASHTRPAIGGTEILLGLFFLVVGPINYYYHSRRNRIRGLLFTVPVISIVFCLLITGYFLATQGFSRQGGSISITALDEPSGRFARWSQHTFFSGLYPMGGFKFDPATAPAAKRQSDTFIANLTNGVHFKSGFYSPNHEFVYGSVTAGKMRERLVFDESGMSVTNGFEQPILKVVVQRGQEIFSAEEIGSGGQATLKPVIGKSGPWHNVDPLVTLAASGAGENEAAIQNWASEIGDTLSAQGDRYVILFRGKPRFNDAGIEFSEGKHLHMLVGVIGAEPTE